MLSSLNYGPLVFLAIQGTIGIVALEVAIRYMAWFRDTSVGAVRPMMLRVMLLGVALCTLSLSVETMYWMHARHVEVATMGTLTSMLSDTYWERSLFRGGLLAGMFCNLVPIWRIVFKYSWWRCAACVVFRVGVGSSLYLLSLWNAGALGCYAFGEACIKF